MMFLKFLKFKIDFFFWQRDFASRLAALRPKMVAPLTYKVVFVDLWQV